jgi:hypothetical protein
VGLSLYRKERSDSIRGEQFPEPLSDCHILIDSASCKEFLLFNWEAFSAILCLVKISLDVLV